jgi:hypothetical protein
MAGGAIGVHVEEPEAALAPSKMAVSLPSTQRSKDNQPATTVRSWVAIAVVIEAWLIPSLENNSTNHCLYSGTSPKRVESGTDPDLQCPGRDDFDWTSGDCRVSGGPQIGREQFCGAAILVHTGVESHLV